MLLDSDPQATSARWVERRNSIAYPPVHCTQKTGDVYKTAIDLGQRYQHVIIDAGGRDTRELRTAMVAADLFYIPVRASQADLETLPHVNELVGLARGMNPALKAFAIVSMAPTNPMISELDDAKELLRDFEELRLSEAVIRDRKIYRDALLEGKGVTEMSNQLARAEISFLAKEIFR
jgi:chromosome partitioning protein